MKRKILSLFSAKRGERRCAGQILAVTVMALALVVGGAETTALLAFQPKELTVEPTGAVWEQTASNLPQNPQDDAQEAVQPEQEPVLPQAAVPESAEQPAQSAPAVPAPEQQPPAVQPPEAEAPKAEAGAEETPVIEVPAGPVGPEVDLDEENSLALFLPATPELEAEDPQVPQRGLTLPQTAQEEQPVTAEPDESGALLLTPEQLDETLAAGRCISLEEENCLTWLWEWLFGSTKYSGWRTENGKTYYYDPNTHQKVTGIQSIENKLYYFDENGVQQDATFGIDVSKYQAQVDWNKVKTSGVEFVIVRIGYRGYETGALVLDPMFEQHFAGAKAAGLRVGVYMFSQAISPEEAKEEAFACAYVLQGRTLDYPIYFDSEYSASATNSGRADKLTAAQRTACAVAFCEEVKANGYRPGVYASTNWFKVQLDMSALTQYSIWNAHYDVPYSSVPCDMWQGSCKGLVNGIPGQVDVNISYIG